MIACQQDPTAEWEKQSLIEYGVPLKIMAPDSIEVRKSNLGGLQDITVKGPENFNLQIFASEVSSLNLSTLVSEQRNLVQEENYFRAFEEEWDAGFIYSMQIDSNTISYDFRHIRIQGDKQYIFQAGMLGNHSKEVIKSLVSAVRIEKEK
jgi:hypothetical protein